MSLPRPQRREPPIPAKAQNYHNGQTRGTCVASRARSASGSALYSDGDMRAELGRLYAPNYNILASMTPRPMAQRQRDLGQWPPAPVRVRRSPVEFLGPPKRAERSCGKLGAAQWFAWRFG
jgi:hypothetical protein